MRTAYLFAISEYSSINGVQSLKTPKYDANRFGKILRKKYNYNVHKVTQNITLEFLREILDKIKSPEFSSKEQFLFYFAGHGIVTQTSNGKPEGYLIPEDGHYNQPEGWLPMHELYQALIKRNPHHLLVILDCCFAGNFRWAAEFRNVSQTQELYQEQYQYFKKHKAWQVITSCAYDEKAMDMVSGQLAREGDLNGQYSPFANLLCKGLEGEADLVPKGGDGIITATELYLYLLNGFAKIRQHAKADQTPGLWPLAAHQKGEFLFEYRKPNLIAAPYLTAENNPYRGLMPYETKHRHLFFGREEEAKRLYQAIVNKNFVVLTGPSGNGKSSLIQAWLIPELLQHPRSRWRVFPILRPGAFPHKTFCQLLEESDLPENQEELDAIIPKWLEKYPDKYLLLVVDQFEEVITQCKDQTEKNQFLSLLHKLLEKKHPRLRVLITVRSDFEPHFSNGVLAPFWKHQNRFLLGRVGLKNMKEMIVKPAAKQALFFDPPDLPDEIAEQLIDKPGALPLLSFTLSELYILCAHKKNTQRTISRQDYEALRGVAGAIIQKADSVLEALPDKDHRDSMKTIFLRMISFEGNELAKRKVFEMELDFGNPIENRRVHTVIDHLLEARLIIKDIRGGEAYWEPAHDELIRGWPQLSQWVGEVGQDTLRLMQQINSATNLWQKGEGALWTDDPKLPAVMELMGVQLNQQTIRGVLKEWIKQKFFRK